MSKITHGQVSLILFAALIMLSAYSGYAGHHSVYGIYNKKDPAYNTAYYIGTFLHIYWFWYLLPIFLYRKAPVAFRKAHTAYMWLIHI